MHPVQTENTARRPRTALPVLDGRRAPAERHDSDVFWSHLAASVQGDVRSDAGTRGLYSFDASNYQHVPLGVVLPRSEADVLTTLGACREAGVPVVCRGGGTSLAGQAVNEAVMLDFSRYMTEILGFDPASRSATVEPGVICDALQALARPHGLQWGPAPATHDRCCFGGMLANNSGGMHAQESGIAVHHVQAMRVALADGSVMDLGWMDEESLRAAARRDGSEGRVYRELAEFRERHAQLIAERLPKLPRRVSGYNLDQLLPGPDGRFNVARALVGSEGTCATMLQATVGLVPSPRRRLVVVAGYDSVFDAGDDVTLLGEFAPLAVEGMDKRLYDHVTKKHMRGERYLDLLPLGHGWLLVELGSDDGAELEDRAEHLMEKLRRSASAPLELRLVRERDQQEHLWKVRESGLGATAFVPGEPDAWPGFEDSAVPPERLGAYLRDLGELFRRYDYSPSLYGHFGMGCVHCRVGFDLTSAGGVAKYRRFMQDAVQLVRRHEGSLSGEHGDGQARGELLGALFGPELYQAFREFKAIWDPDGRMNPGRIVDARPIDRDLRLGPGYDPEEPPTHFHFLEDNGSFARATLRCVGVGKCRRREATGPEDVMCPSFMATGEERHSTRGRARLLWQMLQPNGNPIRGGFQDENVKEALDLCLACKGCKRDCPVGVNMATYKAEFLAHYYRGRLRPRQATAFGHIDRWAALMSVAPGLANLVTQSRIGAPFAKAVAGVARSREIPPFAGETFRAWFARHAPPAAPRKRVLLFTDTFTNHFEPGIAKAAVRVLEHAGYEVEIPPRQVCCGRPLYDYGLLDDAKEHLETVLSTLDPWLTAGAPIVVLEPSCASVFRDELGALLPGRVSGQRLAAQTQLLDELLTRDAMARLPKLRRKALVQGHCHHKSVLGFDAAKKALSALELDAEVLASGCCGMAGAFGFEPDKQEVSLACGERSLLPSVREAAEDTLIVADGFSCRQQIGQNTGRQALHFAEVVELALEHGSNGPPRAEPPEAGPRDAQRLDVRRSMWRAGTALAAGALAVLGATLLASSKDARR